jgi:AcrR family transcriptional regulator
MGEEPGRLTRRERYALATRQAILDAARRLFAERGYFATTVEDIAAAAEVSPATVYSSTGGKQGLLGELLRVWSEDPSVQGTLDEVAASDDAREVIERLGAGAREMRERWDDLVKILLTTAPHDDAVAEQLAPFTAFYRRCIEAIAGRLAELGALREAVGVDEATDVLWLYFGYGSLQTLHDDNGWSYERAERWLVQQAGQALLSEP